MAIFGNRNMKNRSGNEYRQNETCIHVFQQKLTYLIKEEILKVRDNQFVQLIYVIYLFLHIALKLGHLQQEISIKL